MVRQTRRRDRCFLPAAEGGVAKVRFPRSLCQRVLPPAQQASASGSCDMRPCSTATAGEKRAKDGRTRAGGQGSAGGSGETQIKRSRQNGNQVAAVVLGGPKAPGSCDPAGDVSGSEQQGAAEESRAAQLQSVGSLKVTIQQSSDSRAFGHAHPHPAPLHCHVCKLTCGSQQDFQDHMTGSEHLRKLQDVTQSIRLNAHPLLDRGRRPQTQRWCDTCQSHFTGDIIVHRRTTQHKVCKQRGRPFCPVCQRHFRTPRKFVEHMKSAEHKEQVQLEEEQEEELITVDAVGCFQEEEEVEVVDDDEDDDEDEERSETVDSKEQEEEFDPQRTYGSSFVVPVHGFVCLLCKKFFYRATAARHTHCRTHTHYQNLQSHRRGRGEGEDGPAPTSLPRMHRGSAEDEEVGGSGADGEPGCHPVAAAGTAANCL